MEGIKEQYLSFIGGVIDKALAGEQVAVNFGDGIVLELYLGEDKMLHWRKLDGQRTGDKRGNGST